MFRQVGKCLLLASCLIFASCTRLYYFYIDTLKPAKVTLLSEEGSSSRIMIVNNAVAQPNNVGFALEVEENSEIFTDLPIHYMDTLIWDGLRDMGIQLERTQFFEEVYLYSLPIRKDNQWMAVIPLSESSLNDLYEKSGCETILSIDRVLYLNNQKARLVSSLFTHINMKSEVGINCSVYHYGKTVPDTSFMVIDSLKHNMIGTTADSTRLFQLATICLSQNIEQAFQKVVWDITPEWQSSVRTIYISRSSRMQEALAYMKKENWQKAAEKWLTIYEDEEKVSTKAQLAQNIAVSFEARDDINAAIEWMELSNTYYQQDPKSNITEKATAEEYLQALLQRNADNKLLDIQLK